MAEPKKCVLDESKSCTECGECSMCDLEPGKICDNCMKCVRGANPDYAEIQIDAIYESTDMPEDDAESEFGPDAPV